MSPAVVPLSLLPSSVPARSTAPPVSVDLYRILVIDDQADYAVPLATFLKFYGHEVEVALDALTALAMIRRFRPQAVIVDMGLPVVDGRECTRQIRALDIPAPWIIAASGHCRLEDRRAAFQAGVDDYFCKPFRLEALHDRLIAGVAYLNAGAIPNLARTEGDDASRS